MTRNETKSTSKIAGVAHFSFCASGAKRTASPLTPALSPLRGEGVALDTRRNLRVRRRVRAVWSRGPGAWGAAQDLEWPRADGRAPSPLNGERAGVRGGNFPADGTSQKLKRALRYGHFNQWSRLMDLSAPGLHHLSL